MSRSTTGTGGSREQIAGSLDAYVTRQVLAAVARAALGGLLAAAAQAEAEGATLDKLWRQRLERARYAADLARRQDQLAELESRLVTLQLEKDWKLPCRADRLQVDYERFNEELRRRSCRRARGDPGPGQRPAASLDAPSTT